MSGEEMPENLYFDGEYYSHECPDFISGRDLGDENRFNPTSDYCRGPESNISARRAGVAPKKIRVKTASEVGRILAGEDDWRDGA